MQTLTITVEGGTYDIQNAGCVVIATESPANTGPSVSRVIAALAMAAAARLHRQPRSLIVIEHRRDQRAEMDAAEESERVYPDDTYGEAFDLVQLAAGDDATLSNPRWFSINKAAAEALLASQA